ncbi:MAG TPA: hypothetical protein VFK82_10540 [Burkholderiaceae bacterium]|nr:hypothetical protein [Burkholderiaceae bacterium]
MKHVLAGASLVAVGLASSAVWGAPQGIDVWTWRDADGTPVYSQFPPPQGSVAPGASGQVHLPPTDAGLGSSEPSVPPSAGPLDARSQAQKALEEALRELAAARLAAMQGQEPLPGERIGTVSHHSRLRRIYFERQHRLADAVRRAAEAVDRAKARLGLTSAAAI